MTLRKESAPNMCSVAWRAFGAVYWQELFNVTLRRKSIIVFFLTLGAFIFVGCDPTSREATPTPERNLTPTTLPTLTSTPSPTVTPLPPVAVLLVPPQADQQLVAEVQSIMSPSVTEAGYRFQVRPSLAPGDFAGEEIGLVVAVPPDPGIREMAQNHSGTRFLSLGIPRVEPAPNLSVVGADGDRLDQQGFMAGYIAAMITPDWRVGVIGLSDSQETIAARQAFLSGVQFFCGLCNPTYPPFFKYPLYFELGADATTQEWRAAADFMIHRSVETVYLVPGAGDDAMVWYLAQSGVKMIGGKPPSPDLQAYWVASLGFDLLQAFVEFWPDFLNGVDGQAISVPMKMVEVNPDLLSSGKQRLATEVLADVLAGYIDLGVRGEEVP